MRAANTRFHSVALPATVLALSALARAAQAQSAPGSEFETFTVPRDASAPVRAPSPTANAPAAPERPPVRPPVPTTYLNSQVALTLFPGQSALNLGFAGDLFGSDLDSSISVLDLVHGDFSHPGFLQMTRRGRGIRFGDTYSDVLGAAQGLRLFAPWGTEKSSFGLGFYQRLRGQEGLAGLVPAADAQWKLRQGWTGGLMVATDSSWRFTQQGETERLTFSAFGGHDERAGQLEGGAYGRYRLTPRTSLTARGLAMGGDNPVRAANVGLVQRLGHKVLTLDLGRTNRGESSLTQTGVGLYVPIRRHILTFRWLRSAGTGPSGPMGTSVLAGSFMSPLDRRTFVWGGFNLLRSVDVEPATQVNAGVSRQLSRRWDVQAEVTQRLDAPDRHVRLGLGYAITPEWHVRLLYGPSYAASARPNAHAFGIQIRRSFRFVRERAGSVSGTVDLEGQPYPGRLRIMLSNGQSALADGRGRFRIRRVPPGEYTVTIAPGDLPADVSLERDSVPVSVGAGKGDEVRFSLTRVGAVTGTVKVRPNELGEVDPTAGIGVVISAGENRDTATDAERNFRLGGLPRGRYRVRLLTTTIPADFEVVGPPEFEVEIDPDKPAPVVQFEIGPKPRKIDFGPAAG